MCGRIKENIREASKFSEGEKSEQIEENIDKAMIMKLKLEQTLQKVVEMIGEIETQELAITIEDFDKCQYDTEVQVIGTRSIYYEPQRKVEVDNRTTRKTHEDGIKRERKETRNRAERKRKETGNGAGRKRKENGNRSTRNGEKNENKDRERKDTYRRKKSIRKDQFRAIADRNRCEETSRENRS